MKNKQLVIICMTFLTIGYVETLLADPQQGIHLNAEEFMKGGTFCFLEIAEADEWITTIKMIVKPSNDKQGIKVSGIDALRHGVSTHQPTAYNPFSVLPMALLQLHPLMTTLMVHFNYK